MTYVPPEGSLNAEIAIVGDAPSTQEELRRQPFVGPAGQLLDQLLGQAGLLREQCYLTNVMKVRPPKNDFSTFWLDKKQTIPTEQLQDGIENLLIELAALPNLKVIIAFGRQPMHILTGVDGINKWRGSVLSTNLSQYIGAEIRDTFDGVVFDQDLNEEIDEVESLNAFKTNPVSLIREAKTNPDLYAVLLKIMGGRPAETKKDVKNSELSIIETAKQIVDDYSLISLENVLTPQKHAKVLPTFHPAFCLRQWAVIPLVVHDLRRAKELLNKAQEPERILLPYPTKNEIDTMLQDISTKPSGADIECANQMISRISFSVDPLYAISIPFYNIETERVVKGMEWVWRELRGILPTAPLIGQNFTFDMTWLRVKQDVHIHNLIHDTMIAQHVILPGLPSFLKPLSLAMLTSLYTCDPYYKDEGKVLEGKKPSDIQYGIYSARDAAITLEVYQGQIEDKRFKRNLSTFNLEMGLIQRPIKQMMTRGILFDGERQKELRLRAEKELECLSLLVAIEIGYYINLSSPKQLATLLFTEMNLKGGVKKSTDEESLKILQAKYQPKEKDFALLSEETHLGADSMGFPQTFYRECGTVRARSFEEACDKLLSAIPGYNAKTKMLQSSEEYGPEGEWFKVFESNRTKDRKRTENSVPRILNYILQHRGIEQIRKNILSAEADSDGRMRCSYSPTTTTGRFKSSKNPFWTGTNLQNIPRKEGIRSLFKPDPGYYLVESDLEQAELRLVAYLAKEPNLITLLETDGVDIHSEMAMAILQKDTITKEERQLGKRIVHAGNYLISARGLVRACRVEMGLDIGEKQAKALLTNYFQRFPMIKMWHTEIEGALYRNNRTLITPFGRERVFYERWGTELFRKATAFMPQSSIADLLNMCMLRWMDIVEEARNKEELGDLLLQLHDAFYIQVPKDNIRRGLDTLKEAFELPFEIDGKEVIIPASFKVSECWGGKEIEI